MRTIFSVPLVAWMIWGWPARGAQEPGEQMELTFRSGEAVELLIPFYEGVWVRDAEAGLRGAGLERFSMAYPGVLSAPFLGWRRPGGGWRVIHSTAGAEEPVELQVDWTGEPRRLTVKAWKAGALKTLELGGELKDVAAHLREVWWPKGAEARPLAERFDGVNFYVNRWVSVDKAPAVRVNWSVDRLVKRMKREDTRTIQFVYGYDPAGVDLGGRYLWSEEAESAARRIIGANRELAHLSWLNLRTFKDGIPAMGVTVPVPEEIAKAAKVYGGEVANREEPYVSSALRMCLATEAWQNSRFAQFDRLVDAGFRVIQIDEFPIPPVWNAAGCQAEGHLHAAGDFRDEWRVNAAFLRELGRRAREKGVYLTSEEPSLVLLPFVSGYIDRQYNTSIDLYASWRKSERVSLVPLFSLMFGEFVTPYTDLEEGNVFVGEPPAGWLRQYKRTPGWWRW